MGQNGGACGGEALRGASCLLLLVIFPAPYISTLSSGYVRPLQSLCSNGHQGLCADRHCPGDLCE